MKTKSAFLFFVWFCANLATSDSISAQEKMISRSPEPVVLGLSSKHIQNLPVYMADKFGIFENEGLQVRLITARTGVNVAALISREMDYINALSSGIPAAIGGAPLVGVYNYAHQHLLYLITRPEITNAKALRGGIVGHGGTRGAHYHASTSMVKYLGLDPEKDVQLISVGDVANGMAALFSGHVAAVTLAPPYDSIAVRKGYTRLVSGPDVLEKYPGNGLLTHRLKLRNNPDEVRRIIRAITKGVQITLSRRADAIALIEREWKLDQETATIAYEAAAPTLNLRGEITDDILKSAIEQTFRDIKMTQSEFAPKDFVNWTLVREVRRELNIK